MSVTMSSQRHWEQYGVSEEIWNSLACLVSDVDERGIKLYCLSQLGCKQGLELIFESPGVKPVVLNVAPNGQSRIEFYRKWDHGPESTRMCGDVKQNWEQIAKTICFLR